MSLPYKFKTEAIIEERRTNRENINQIQTWLNTTHFPNLQEELVVLFLASCNNDVEDAQTTIKHYFKIKSRAPELFSDRDIDNASMEKVREVTISVILPKRISNTVVHFSKIIDTDYKKLIITDVFKQGIMAIDSSQMQSPPNNMIVIIDMEGLSLMHLTCVKISAIKYLIDYVQDGMPLKITKIHILNTTYVVEKVLAIVRLFMKPELAAAMEVHSVGMPLEDFHEKWLPAEYMPKEYGGLLPSYMNMRDDMIKKFREMKAFFEAEEKLIDSYKASNLWTLSK